MERLSGLDASFLYLETPTQVMNVAAILQLDPSTVPGGYSFRSMRAEMARRVSAIPSLRRKLADSLTNIDHPVWIEDDDFRIERHVHRMAVPSPGTMEELSMTCSHLMGQTLDRKKPLWDMWVLEGMENDRIALMLRMHHACVDGATVADLLGELATPTPDAPELDPERVAATAGPASRRDMAVGGASNVLLQRPVAALKLIPKTLPVPFEWIRRVRSGLGMPAPFLAPHTRFNAPLTPRRSLALTQLPLADVKKVKEHFGVKVNDVVLAMTGGALREYLADHGELPDGQLVGLVPVSVRHAEEKDLVESGTNKVTGMFTRLPSDLDDPIARIRAAREYANLSKEHLQNIDDNMLRAFAEFAPGNSLGALMRIYGDRRLSALHPAIFTTVISNVAGPPGEMYLLGGRVESVYPLAPIFHGLGLNMTVFSAADRLNLGIVTCPDLADDIDRLAQAFHDQLAILVDAVDRGETLDDAAEA